MTKPWADKPFTLVATPTDTAGISEKTVQVATEMALAHNIMVRNLNSIYLQAENVKEPKDIADFMIFCQTSYEEIHHHHSIEEEYFFPWIEEYTGEKGIMEVNLQQHKAFDAGAEKFKEYVFGTRPESYDGKELKKVIDGFGPALTVHLAAEIQTLLGLDKYGADKLAEAWKKLDKIAFDSIKEKHRVLPAGLGGNDVTFEKGKNKNWPPIPWFVPYLVKYIYARRHAGAWRFCPCTIFGQPKELPFVKEE